MSSTSYSPLWNPPSSRQEELSPFSEDTTRDQVFVEVAIREMLKKVDEEMFRDGMVLIQGDNFPSQYKCAEHFAYLQQLSNEYNSINIY